MRNYLLLSEVKDFVKNALESLENQTKEYSYEEIVELERKAAEKYNALYKKKAFSSHSYKALEGKKIRALHYKYITLNYLKNIMEVLKLDSTSKIDRDMDIDELSLKVLEKTDRLGYSKYLENKNKR